MTGHRVGQYPSLTRPHVTACTFKASQGPRFGSFDMQHREPGTLLTAYLWDRVTWFDVLDSSFTPMHESIYMCCVLICIFTSSYRVTRCKYYLDNRYTINFFFSFFYIFLRIIDGIIYIYHFPKCIFFSFKLQQYCWHLIFFPLGVEPSSTDGDNLHTQ